MDAARDGQVITVERGGTHSRTIGLNTSDFEGVQDARHDV